MARISLIICDWCKQEYKESQVQDKIILKHEDGREKEFEICRDCLRMFKSELESEDGIGLGQGREHVYREKYARISEEKLEDAISRIVTETAELYEPGPVEVFADDDGQPKKTKEQFEREFKEASKLKDGELQVLPSNWVRPTRKEVVEQERRCRHTHKSYEGGQIICVDAPPDYHGEGNRKGCGKVLEAHEI